MLASHSQIATFRTCPRKWKHVYVDRRVPRVEASKALRIGNAVDAALKGGPLPEDPADRAMVLGHRARWRDSGLTITDVDVPFVYTLANETIGSDGIRRDGIEINGELDAIATDANGDRVGIEIKTTSKDIAPGGHYWRHVMLIDPQASAYLHALGLRRLVWDALRKPALRQGKKETADAFHIRVLTDISENLDYYYQRAVIVRLEADHEDFVRDVLGTVHLMQTGHTPRNPGSCFNWNRECEYFSVCSGQARLDDDNIFMDRTHTQGAAAARAKDRALRSAQSGQIDIRSIDAGTDRYRF